MTKIILMGQVVLIRRKQIEDRIAHIQCASWWRWYRKNVGYGVIWDAAIASVNNKPVAMGA